MSKKYLSLEEAAQMLGISVDTLKQHREDGDVRGFADRGSWKFREEDVEKFGRTLSTDSSPEVPLLDADNGGSIFDDEDEVGSQATIVSSGDDSPLGVSDSDVRLVDSSGGDDDSGFDIPLLTDSDSDVRLVDDVGTDSDSDVKLVSDDSDSDVRLAPNSETEGEIDLMGSDSFSDSDIRLIDDSDTKGEPASGLLADDDQLPTVGDSATLAADSGALGAAGSGVLGAAPLDSGISLESADSGMTLEAADSGLTLELADSGISLEGPGSGLTLDAAESGLSLDDDDDAMTLSADSGISLESDDMYQTIPMLESGEGDEGGDTTHVEVPVLDSNESDFEIGALDADDDSEIGSDSNVLMFDEDEDDDDAQTVMAEDDEFDLDSEYDDDLEVADDDLLGEDDELDVFDADDDDFDDGFEAGESHSDFAAPAPVAMAPVEADWGVGTFIGLILSAGLMCLCCIVVFDLVQAMWAFEEPSAFSGALLDSVGGLF